MNFDRPGDPAPLSAEVAVKRGKLLVNGPVQLLQIGLLVGGFCLIKVVPLLAIVMMVIAVPCAWLWWSFSVPRWRFWALSRGADPVQLQRLGQAANLIWPKGSLFEKTEFRYRGLK
jgi:hypothetical protein